MKNQYFGDINDYKKYSLLRILGGHGQIRTTVCWVLTKDDNRSDGSRIKYLEKPEQWQNYDPVVFKYLRYSVLKKGMRDVSMIERDYILPNCSFYREYIGDDSSSREKYFNKFYSFSKGTDLIFFDPDNGLEVNSVPRGKKGSSKYVYWDEIRTSYEAGHSVLIYQHFPRKPRELFLRNLVRKIREIIGTRRVFSYCTYHVTFLLLTQPNHEHILTQNNNNVKEVWGEIIKIGNHELAGSTV
jgi:hypothetical protein